MTLRTIDKYQINAFLGSGTMGRVYKVTIPVLKKTAALKLFKPNPALIRKAGMEWLKENFIREAAVIANIRHPNVVDIWSLEDTKSGLFYLMEYYCRNLGNLMGETYWADRPSRIVPPEKACHYMFQILEGLGRLHQADIIHRDIKPFNIMLTDMGTVRIVDFGLSGRRGEIPVAPDEKMMIGTPFYTAPEQIKSPDQVDHKADLYAAGVIFYRMLTGRLPQTDNPLPGTLQPGLGTVWDKFTCKALAPDPDDRFRTAAHMAIELKKSLQDHQEHIRKECTALPDDFPETVGQETGLVQEQKKIMLRARPERILAKRAKSIFQLNELHQPKIHIQNKFSEQKDIIIDHATNLAWQKSGSAFPLQWHRAQAYIEKLAGAKAGGFINWRLPTVNELMSLLDPPSQEPVCLASKFSSTQKWIWSADTRSKKAAWIIDVEMGFVASSDVLDYYFVKGVCSL